MLQVKNLTYHIHAKKIAHEISFCAQKSKLKALIGPNGAGKTTLLKLIGKILKAKNGEVIFDNTSLSQLPVGELSQIVSYMPQFASYPDMKVLKVLELGRYPMSGSRLQKNDRDIIDEMIERFGLQKSLDANIASLSGGEKQKILLASALVQEPKILLLDEPISHLDPKNQLEVLRNVKKITKEKEIVTLVVLHDIAHALHFADELLMMKAGEVLFDIPSSDIQETHLDALFDVTTRLFKHERHTFVYYEHSHQHTETKHHVH